MVSMMKRQSGFRGRRFAGIDSSDYDEEFDSKSFADGFSKRIRSAVEKYVSGFRVAEANATKGGVQFRIPCLSFAAGASDGSASYADGMYEADFRISVGSDASDGTAVVFSLVTSVYGSSSAGVWHDSSTYSVHVTSISGERVGIRMAGRGFVLSSIGGIGIEKFATGEAVIDEFGASGADGDPAEISKENLAYISECLSAIADRIGQKLLNWEKNNRVAETIAGELERSVSDYDRKRRGEK